MKQQGSWVGPDRLRFDFSHFEGLTPDQIVEIEDLANREILTDAGVTHEEMSKGDAMALGAIAFFGDKYGDTVRVLKAGNHSVEFCGGTHVRHGLGEIGPVKIVSETSIGSNIRRLEAIAGLEPINLIRAEERTLAEIAGTLGVPVGDIADGLRKRLDENKAQKAEIAALRRQVAQAQAGDLVDDAVDGVLVARIEAETRDEVRDLAMSLRDRPDVRVVVLMSSPGGKGVAVASAVDPTSGLNAGEIIADAVKLVGGGGGKGELVATAGGRDAGQIDAALDLVRAALLPS
ncbi:MAG: DHHA1 domain-containing protein [Acidimicrobiales bacterium]